MPLCCFYGGLKMRGLEFQDVFSMARILTKVELDKEIESMLEKTRKGEKLDTEAVGIKFVTTILGKASTKEVEKEIYAFLGDVFEIKPDDLRHMKPKQVKELFKDADFEEWKDFFTDVVRFVRQS